MVWAHLLNIALVGAVARQLYLKPSGVFFAMMVYSVFPFHAQAVLWIGAGFHLLLTILVLFASVAALRSLHNWHWIVPAIVAGGLAPFAHETGVVTAALVFLIVWAQLGWRGLWQKRVTLVAILFSMLMAAALYWLLRSQFVASSPFTFDLEKLLFNGAFFAQGYSLPTQVIASLFTGDAVLRTWIAALVFALMTIPLLRRRGRLALVCVLWGLVALAPAMVLLHPNYIRYGERLITIAVPMIAIVFGLLLERGRKWVRFVLGGFFIVSCITFAWEYVALHHLHGDYYRQLFAQLKAYDTDTPMLIVNMPSQSERPFSPLPLARANVGLLTDWLQLRDFLWLNMDGREYTHFQYAHIRDWEENLPELSTQFYGNDVALAELPDLYKQQATIWQTVAREGQWIPDVLGQRISSTSSEGTRFADAIRLKHATATLDSNHVRVELFWRYENAPDSPYTIFVHLLCDGQVIAQTDGDPFNNTYPFALWDESEAWMEVRSLAIPANTDTACLSVNIGLYNRDTLERAEGEVEISVMDRP